MDWFLVYIVLCKKFHKIRCIHVDSSIILKDLRRSDYNCFWDDGFFYYLEETYFL